MAQDGQILDRADAVKTCTPSRSSLQSGRLPIHVTEQLKVPDNPTAAVPYNFTTISELLSSHSNYTSHLVGKWDAGMATPRHTPFGRGYSNSSLSYFSHKNEFFTHETLQVRGERASEASMRQQGGKAVSFIGGSGPRMGWRGARAKRA
jgi:arylsulfatase I/J